MKMIFSAKEMAGGAKRSYQTGAMKKLMSNSKIKQVLDQRVERREFFSELKKYGGGGITQKEMQKIFGKFKYDRTDSLNAEETRIIAREILGSGKRYLNPLKRSHQILRKLLFNKQEEREAQSEGDQTGEEIMGDGDRKKRQKIYSLRSGGFRAAAEGSIVEDMYNRRQENIYKKMWRKREERAREIIEERLDGKENITRAKHGAAISKRGNDNRISIANQKNKYNVSAINENPITNGESNIKDSRNLPLKKVEYKSEREKRKEKEKKRIKEFGGGKVFSETDVKGGRAMKKLMENGEIRKVLNNRVEQRELFSEIMKYGEDGITNEEMQKVFGKFKYDANDSLNAEEIRVIAREVLGSGKRYINPKKRSHEVQEKMIKAKQEEQKEKKTEERDKKEKIKIKESEDDVRKKKMFSLKQRGFSAAAKSDFGKGVPKKRSEDVKESNVGRVQKEDKLSKRNVGAIEISPRENEGNSFNDTDFTLRHKDYTPLSREDDQDENDVVSKKEDNVYNALYDSKKRISENM